MRFFIVCAFLFLSLFANTPKEVLLLHSYNKGLKWSDGISQGVEEILKLYPHHELTTEFMDSKKIDTDEYFQALVELYTKKFASRTYDVVIAADNYAFEFVLKHHRKIFNEAPVVFCGLENFDKKNIPIEKQRFITGVIEYKEIDQNLRLIDKTIPDLDTLYIISDNSFSSLAIKDQIIQTARAYDEKFDFIYDNDISLLTLETKIASLPEKSAILFTSLYKDRKGKYIPYNTIREFFQNSPYPVFALNKIHLGEGVIGGVMINPHDQGAVAAKKTIEILNGKSPLQIDISKPAANTYFDRRILDKFGFLNMSLPFGASVINEPKSFFERNRKFIDSAFVMMPILLALVVFLVFTISRKISLEIKLLEQSKLDSVLLNNIQSAIFWKGNDDIMLGCNKSLCDMLGLHKDQIIGQHIKNVLPEVCEKVSMKKEFITELEVTLKNTCDRVIDVIIRRQKFSDKKGQKAGVVTVISDITQIKKLQLQRKKEEQFLVQRSKLSEIGEMMASIAHQWKTPLVEISSIAQELFYMNKKRPLGQDQTKVFVDDIMTQVQYMTQTIDEFRDFIKPSNAKSYFNVNESIQEVIKLIDHSIRFNYIDLLTECECRKAPVTYGYPNEFKQSVLNIINNAKESILIKKSKSPFEGRIEIKTEVEKDKIFVSIKDNGLGIQQEQFNDIFEPYVSSKIDGDGFGLYMAKMIIEDKMGGSIQAIPQIEGAKIVICVEVSEHAGDMV